MSDFWGAYRLHCCIYFENLLTKTFCAIFKKTIAKRPPSWYNNRAVVKLSLGVAFPERNNDIRNHVRIGVVVPPKTAGKAWFYWAFARLMIFLTVVSNGFSKKFNNDCFPHFWGWTYTERYRSGRNGADSKSLASCGTLDLVKPWKRLKKRGNRSFSAISLFTEIPQF